MTTLAIQIDDANARILEDYARSNKITIDSCINKLIAELHQRERTAYLKMLEESNQALREGRTITKTFAELEAMEHE